jgi:hypothetical protein
VKRKDIEKQIDINFKLKKQKIKTKNKRHGSDPKK